MARGKASGGGTRQQWADFIAKGQATQQAADKAVMEGIRRRNLEINSFVPVASRRTPGELSTLEELMAFGSSVVRIETPVTVAPVNLAGKIGRHGERTTIRDGIKFRSNLEADRYSELKLLRQAGPVAWFLRQVPFDVTLGVIYRADFVVIWNRIGTASEVVTVEDTKGHLTDVARIKMAAVEERYAIKINILRRCDVSRHG